MFDLLEIGGVGAYAFPTEPMAQAGDFSLGKETLLGVQLESCFGYGAKDQVEMLQVFFHGT